MSITDQDSRLQKVPKDYPRTETRAESESAEALANEPIEFVSQPRMAKELDCTVRSLNRKKPVDPDFPILFGINGRKYSRRPDFEHYKRIPVQRGLQKPDQRACANTAHDAGEWNWKPSQLVQHSLRRKMDAYARNCYERDADGWRQT
jgi:hypothetical protein